jgi:3-hydroxybutyryl-CoA dehydratase
MYTQNMSASRAPVTQIVDDDTPSRIMTIGDLVVGDAVEQIFAFDAKHRLAFTQVANDRAPVHEDERFAHARGFGGTIIQGLCVATRFSRLIGMYLPGEHAILESISLKYIHPTYEGQSLLFRAEVTRLLLPMKVVRLAVSAMSNAVIQAAGEAQCLIR